MILNAVLPLYFLSAFISAQYAGKPMNLDFALAKITGQRIHVEIRENHRTYRLDISGNRYDRATQVYWWYEHNRDNQQFYLRKTKDNWYYLEAVHEHPRHKKLCVDN